MPVFIKKRGQIQKAQADPLRLAAAKQLFIFDIRLDKVLVKSLVFITAKADHTILLKDSLEQCCLPEILYFHVLAYGLLSMFNIEKWVILILNNYLIKLSSFNPNLCQ